jgi:hypothetical protein
MPCWSSRNSARSTVSPLMARFRRTCG